MKMTWRVILRTDFKERKYFTSKPIVGTPRVILDFSKQLKFFWHSDSVVVGNIGSVLGFYAIHCRDMCFVYKPDFDIINYPL